MKKILMGSIALMVFSVSIALFQLSCSKDAAADNDNGIDRTILFRRVTTDGDTELWSVDSDGNNSHKINIAIPAEHYLYDARVVENGKKIVFGTFKSNETVNIRTFFKCNLDGTGVTEILVSAQNEEFVIQDVF